MARKALGIAMVVGTLSGAGCHHRGDGAEAEMPRSAERQSRSAVNDIAEARCEREQRCENVGDGKKFASDDACEDSVRADWAGDLNAYECPNGIVDAELDECLSAIRAEDCGAPFDTLQRITACSASDICAD